MSRFGLDVDVDRDRTGYDSTTETYHVQHDWESGKPLAMTVVTVVEVLTDRETTEIEPLYESVDPDALEQTLRSLRIPGDEVGGKVGIEFAGLSVVARSDGHVYVHCAPEDVPKR